MVVEPALMALVLVLGDVTIVLMTNRLDIPVTTTLNVKKGGVTSGTIVGRLFVQGVVARACQPAPRTWSVSVIVTRLETATAT
jgi:hypothetical protein